jgi:hypothetical protein
MGDNVYTLNRQSQPAKVEVQTNDGCCGIFETEHDGKVNRCIVEYAATHSRKDTFLYNNRLYLGTMMRKVHTDQYHTNHAHPCEVW